MNIFDYWVVPVNIKSTVEPLYSGLIGTSEFVLIMEVKLYSKVLVRDLNECP